MVTSLIDPKRDGGDVRRVHVTVRVATSGSCIL